MKFVIIAMPRSGTSLLVNTLNSLDNINCYGELFVKDGSDKNFIHEQKVQQEMVRRRNRNCYDQSKHKNIYDYLDDIYSRGKNVGFKLLYPHLTRVEKYDIIKYLQINDIHKIFLWRDNELRRQISNMTNNKKEKIIVDPEKLGRAILRGLDCKHQLVMWFGFGSFSSNTYEELTGEKDIKELDLSWTKLPVPNKVKTPLKKYGSNKIKDRIENYDEVHKWFMFNAKTWLRWFDG